MVVVGRKGADYLTVHLVTIVVIIGRPDDDAHCPSWNGEESELIFILSLTQ